eukprot:scaffold6774_cov66-Phaeocystis_antarctica.AAC.3
MPTMPTICVWRPSALTWGERYGTTRQASEESGTPPGTQVPLNMGVGVGVRRRGAAVAMAMTRGAATAPNAIAAAAMTMLDRVWGACDGGGVTLPKQRRLVELYRWHGGVEPLRFSFMGLDVRSSFWLMSFSSREFVSRG